MRYGQSSTGTLQLLLLKQQFTETDTLKGFIMRIQQQDYTYTALYIGAQEFEWRAIFIYLNGAQTPVTRCCGFSSKSINKSIVLY